MNRVAHFEIPTDDKAKAAEFYRTVFGWQIMDIPVQMGGGTGTYTVAMTTPTDPQTQMPTEPGGINGAIVERSGQITAPVITIYVDSIDDCLAKLAEAGGTVLVGKQNIENMGSYAYATDVSGNVIGLWQNAG